MKRVGLQFFFSDTLYILCFIRASARGEKFLPYTVIPLKKGCDFSHTLCTNTQGLAVNVILVNPLDSKGNYSATANNTQVGTLPVDR